MHGTRYCATIATLNAADYGVPQLRRRVFVIGARDGTQFNIPAATHRAVDEDTVADTDWTDSRPRHLTAWDALHDLPEPNECDVQLKGKWAELLPTIPEGSNYLWHTDRGGGEPLFGWRRRYWSFLLKLAKNQPAWTIQAQPGPATGPFHWNNRRLTMREMARLQTFPNDVEILGTITDAQRQLGNAVPSHLAEMLARAIAWQLLGARNWPTPVKLAIPPARNSPPEPETPLPLPARFLALRGTHEAHPGTGKGNRAAARLLAASE
jgi:DNA (cytosine-5)-methyltransferase 1